MNPLILPLTPSRQVILTLIYLQIRTNRGRECHWGEKGVQDWYRLEPPPGETLVGLVMAFAEPRGYDNEKKTYAHCKMSFVGALSMPLGIPEES